MAVRHFFFLIAAVSALIIDTIFAIGRYPVLTIFVCVIVVVYELVSPFIYTSR